jgi:hypothetical protein
VTFHLVKRHCEGDSEPNILAATGVRPHAKGNWKYCSCNAFISSKDQPWSDLGLKPFKATSRNGVQEWLHWLVEHTPIC